MKALIQIEITKTPYAERNLDAPAKEITRIVRILGVPVLKTTAKILGK